MGLKYYYQIKLGVCMNAEIIAKMLTSAVGINRVTSTAKSGLTKAELAGVLAGLSSIELDFALAKYGDDDNAKRSLLNQVVIYTVKTAFERHWKPRDGALLNGLARVAVYEVLKDSQCPKCNGTGFAMARVCKFCSGTGKKSLSGRTIANELGINEKTYREFWVDRYAVIYDYVSGLDLELWCKLKKFDTPAKNT